MSRRTSGRLSARKRGTAKWSNVTCRSGTTAIKCWLKVPQAVAIVPGGKVVGVVLPPAAQAVVGHLPGAKPPAVSPMALDLLARRVGLVSRDWRVCAGSSIFPPTYDRTGSG